MMTPRQLRLLGWQSDGLSACEADDTAIELVRRAAIADESVAAALVPQR